MTMLDFYKANGFMRVLVLDFALDNLRPLAEG